MGENGHKDASSDRIRLAVRHETSEQISDFLNVAEKWVAHSRLWFGAFVTLIVAISAVLLWIASFAKKQEVDALSRTVTEIKSQQSIEVVQRENMQGQIADIKRVTESTFNAIVNRDLVRQPQRSPK